VDFSYCENFNDLLEVEWMGGDSEIMEKEFAEGRYCHDQLHPETGGQYFRAQLEGAGYRHQEVCLW
jgi:predicted Rdx family selenoprotein